MRKVQTPLPRRKRKKNPSGCGSCLGKCLSFLIVASVIIAIGVQVLPSMGLTRRLMQTQYPIKYQNFVEKYAAEFSLEQELVFAIIRTESKFDPYAVSKTGARGLMQIQSETAEDCFRELHLSNFTSDALFDPEVNIRIGCYYFSKLLKRYEGKVSLAVAAYNGGLGNVEKWLQDKEYTNAQGELVKIPFSETRNYVMRVNRAYEKYCELY